MDKTEKSTPNPAIALWWFLLITTFYFVIPSLIPSLFTMNPTKKARLFFVYLLLLIGGEWMINIGLTKSMCGSEQSGTAALATIVPWMVIFGMMNVMLQMFPGWLRPFSNTIGYLFTKGGISRTMREILKGKLIDESGKDSVSSDVSNVQKALATIYEDKSLLVNEITTSNFDDFWKKLSPLFKKGVKDNADLKNTLLKHIDAKESIAKYVWYLLTGGLITSASYNYIVNAGCTFSVDEIKKRDNEHAKTVKEKAANDKSNTARVYQTFE